jgi:hypothetical protein
MSKKEQPNAKQWEKEAKEKEKKEKKEKEKEKDKKGKVKEEPKKDVLIAPISKTPSMFCIASTHGLTSRCCSEAKRLA